MVKGINRAGLRVVMDVVYNHTPAAGQDPKSILDRIVPGYYHRLSPTGSVETSTCCSNTATEHRMMEKLMVESVVTWAREYKVDGFRFDLMGHHSKANMLKVRRALDKLGRDIYVYGEGWNFGEVANDARFVQATQLNMAGTGIGTFSDRLRDAVRGGGPFDEDPRIQGFASGLFTDPNGAAVNGTPEEQRARLLLYQDQIKVGLAGNLRDYRFVDRNGQTVTGSQVDYNGQPAGYAAEPSETITYVDAHDNETLFDVLQYKLPQATPMADRVRMNTVALSTTALAQGPSFWHAGTDLLRSKSLDRNSFNSGDWFNRIDWSYDDSTWGSGLPPRGDNESKWVYMRPLLADPALEPSPADIRAARDRAAELLRIRFSSPLFRLGSAREIQRRVSFPAGGPGVIVMAIEGGIVVVFNATPFATTQTIPALAHRRYALHEVQARGGDPVVQGIALLEAARSPCRAGRRPSSSVVLGDEDAAGREPALGQPPRPLGLAVEEPDTHGEDLVEAPVAEVGVLEPGDEELGRAVGDIGGVPPRRGLDHLRRAVDRRQPRAALAHQRGRDAVPAADLQHALAGPHVEPVHHAAQPLAHFRLN